ncbi:MAG: hypothetical protein QMD05_06635 [Candidatus Brocadiaceae bacterium]|nr:hypothetical protein [Candidatus Brocadiaceae bacterium]
MRKNILVLILILLIGCGDLYAQFSNTPWMGSPRVEQPNQKYLGNLSANPFVPNSTNNMFGKGSPFNPDSINNPFGRYGSPFSNTSANNPFATEAPKLYDQQGNYRGKLSTNPLDLESISNPMGRFGNPFSSDSINNPFGAGNQFRFDSPKNPFGPGWSIFGEK